MTDLRIAGQVAEVLDQADNPSLRVTQLVTETLFQATDPPVCMSQQNVEALVSLAGGSCSTMSPRTRLCSATACGPWSRSTVPSWPP